MKYLLLTVLAAAAGFLLFYGSKKEGYCLSKGRHMTHAELIRVAVQTTLEKYPPPVIRKEVSPGHSSWSSPPNPIAYKNAEDFLVQNEDCCEIRPIQDVMEGRRATLLERIFGGATTSAKVRYLVRFRGEDGEHKSEVAYAYQFLSDCGEPVDSPSY